MVDKRGDTAPGHALADRDVVAPHANTLLDVRDLTIQYGDKTALKNVTLDVRRNEIFGIIGPANAGKTSFLRSLNRMDEFVHTMKVGGKLYFAGRDLSTVRNLYALRRMIGVVFPLPENTLDTVLTRYHAGNKLPVEAWDRGDVKQQAVGVLQSLDNQIDVATGTLQCAANSF